MIKIKRMTDDHISGMSMVLFYIFSLNCSYSTHKGDHVNISLGLLCFEAMIGFSIWKKLLP